MKRGKWLFVSLDEYFVVSRKPGPKPVFSGLGAVVL